MSKSYIHAQHILNSTFWHYLSCLFSVANDALISVWVYKGHRPDLTVIAPEAPKELITLIKDCWVAEPKKRPRFKGN